ncbi:hypothetical protein AgCh_009514 [Apium graveolens]
MSDVMHILEEYKADEDRNFLSPNAEELVIFNDEKKKLEGELDELKIYVGKFSRANSGYQSKDAESMGKKLKDVEVSRNEERLKHKALKKELADLRTAHETVVKDNGELKDELQRVLKIVENPWEMAMVDAMDNLLQRGSTCLDIPLKTTFETTQQIVPSMNSLDERMLDLKARDAS